MLSFSFFINNRPLQEQQNKNNKKQKKNFFSKTFLISISSKTKTWLDARPSHIQKIEKMLLKYILYERIYYLNMVDSRALSTQTCDR